MNRSVLIYVQHLLGIGHLRRALYLVEAMAREGFAVTLVSGGQPLPDLAATPARRVVQLPSIRTSDPSFKMLVGADGQPVDEALWSARRELLLAAFVEARPRAVMIEAYPFGRRAFRHELQALIATARGQHPPALVLCSLRDIVVPPERGSRQRETVDCVRSDFDAVLVHGDPRFVALDASFPLLSEIADKIVYTGYVTAPAAPVSGGGSADAGTGDGEILVSAGGGAMGSALLQTALATRRRGLFDARRWRLLAGPNLPAADFARLTEDLPEGVVVERYRRDFPQLLRRCRVSISQGGYNTVLEVVAAGVPAVVVPFANLRESEQTVRAERLAACGVLEMVPAASLSADRLAAAVKRAVRRRPAALAIDISGAHRTAVLVGDMLAKRAMFGGLRKTNTSG